MTPDIMSTLTTQQKDFTDEFSKKLISSSLKNLIERAIPFEGEEIKALQNDKFKNGLSEISKVMVGDVASTFQKTGIMSSGSFFDNLVGTVENFVSMEANERIQEVLNDIKLGKLDTSNIEWMNKSHEHFETLDFKNKDIKNRFIQEFKSILSLEEENVVNNIKESVVNSINEAEAKAEIIKTTSEEINKVKEEYAKPEEPLEPVEKPLIESEKEMTEGGVDETTDQNTDKDEKINIAEEVAKQYIPITLKQFKNREKSKSTESMVYDFFKATGDIKKEVNIRLQSLKYSIESSNDTKEDMLKYLEEYEDFDNLTKESLDRVDFINDVFLKLGITQNGLYKTDSVSLEVAKNITDRFINKKIPISVYPKEMTNENAISNAFEIIQLKQDLKENKYKPDVKSSLINELESRENAFYKNIVNITDPKIKEAALNIVKLQDIKFINIVNANFVKDFNMKVWETNVKNIKDLNELAKSRAVARIENIYKRPLNDEEFNLIEAILENQDVIDIIPTEFEKFIVKFGKEELKNSNESFSDSTKNKIKFKAKVFTAIYKTLEHLNIIDSVDKKKFDKFLNAF